MSIINKRKLLLLGMLRYSDMHGYMLNAHLDSTIPITIKKPTAYNLLEIMEKDGWITHQDEYTGDRAKKVYSLTKEGNAKFLQLLKQQLSTFTPSEHPGIVSISFLDELPETEALELLNERKKQLDDYLELFSGTDNGNLKTDDNHSGSARLAIEYTHRALKLEKQFLKEVISARENS